MNKDSNKMNRAENEQVAIASQMIHTESSMQGVVSSTCVKNVHATNWACNKVVYHCIPKINACQNFTIVCHAQSYIIDVCGVKCINKGYQ